MSKQSLALLFSGATLVGCVLLLATARYEPRNAIPEGDQLQHYNRDVSEIEGQAELDN